MNFSEIQSAVKHLQKTCKCTQCKAKYKPADINVLASTSIEALFELKCEKCDLSAIVTVTNAAEEEIRKISRGARQHSKISENDILDIKNFLNNFDGNFKELFKNKK
jgi:hypothetical protein